MSGTSMDGVDAAIGGFSSRNIDVVQTHFTPYPDELKAKLNALIQPEWRGGLGELLDIDHEIGLLFAQTAIEILDQTPDLQIAGIGSHGQTVHHQPDSNKRNSWQLGDPNLIAEATGITTISDWRRRDMAAGGQGAPLTPAFHARYFRCDHDVVVLNLGGIANISILPRDSTTPIIGFDTGPANTLIDILAARHLSASFDKDGNWAATGQIHKKLLESMLADPYFKLSPPKSTGREYFNQEFLQRHLDTLQEDVPARDIQATLTELTAISVNDAIQETAHNTREVLVCGGGAYNTYLLLRLQAHAERIEWNSTAERGIDPEHVEAIAFAWFAKQSLEGKPLALESITGAHSSRIAGAIYPA